MPKPPKTRRYCAGCDSIQVFQYEPMIGHSTCTRCGWRLVPTTMTDAMWQELKRKTAAAWEKWDKGGGRYDKTGIKQIRPGSGVSE